MHLHIRDFQVSAVKLYYVPFKAILLYTVGGIFPMYMAHLCFFKNKEVTVCL